MFDASKSCAVRLSVLAVAASLAGCSGESGIRGSYLNHDDSSGALLVQIDDVHDHNVNGTISIVGTDAKGQIISRRTPLSGTIDGKALNLSMENGTGSGMVTGTVVPTGLQLTLLGNGQSMRLLFKRADPAEFDRIVSDVRTKATQARQETAAAVIEEEHTRELTNIQRAIESTADRLLFDARAVSEKSRQVENVIAGYPRFTARAAQLRAAAKQVDPRNDMTGRLDDIRWRLSANRDTVTDAHSGSQAAVRDLEGPSTGDVDRANQFLGECQTDRRLNCTHLATALNAYATSAAGLRASVARETAAFESQRAGF
jgi:hypothetical protein